MSDFPTKAIGELTATVIDYRGKTPKKSDSGIWLVTAKNIKHGVIKSSPREYVPAETYDRVMRRGIPQFGDIVITTEAPLGEVGQIRTAEKIALAQRVILLRGNPDLINQNYYFYALQSYEVQGRLKARATGTTVLGIKQSELRQVLIPLPPLHTQRKIAAILSAYDDLIENNNRRIKLLEQAAQDLYREWFVHFRFPGHEDVEMVDSGSDYGGMIPRGWEVGCLGDIAVDKRKSVKPAELDPSTPYVGLEHIPRKTIALSEWGEIGDVSSTKFLFTIGDILFGRIRSYLHKVAVAPIDGVTSTDTIVILPRIPEFYANILMCVSSNHFIEFATAVSQGTKMPRANWKIISQYPIALPPIELVSEFNEFVGEIVRSIHTAIFKNHVLREARDILLPRLVSGELDVSKIEIQGLERGDFG